MATSFPASPRSTLPVSRPIGVTLIVILTWLAAIGDVIGGFVLIADADSRSMRHDLGMTEMEIRWYGIFLVGIGIVTALVAIGLGRGASWARGLVAIVMGVRIVSALYALTQVSWENQRSTAVGTLTEIAISALVLFVLYGQRADRYFRDPV